MDSPRLLQQAIQHHQAGRLEKAERAYQKLLKSNPRQPDVLHNLGVLLMQQGHWGQAGELLKQALEIRPGEGQYWLSCLEYLLHAGLLPQMEQMLTDGRQKGLQGPTVDNLASRLAQAQRDAAQMAALETGGDYNQMERLARTAWEQQGPNPARAHALGKALLLLRRDQEALPLLQQACEGAPAHVTMPGTSRGWHLSVWGGLPRPSAVTGRPCNGYRILRISWPTWRITAVRRVTTPKPLHTPIKP
ncbi:tetratricopeptide repeat protein [Magnetovirga frankeli]|nr:tetratricopeptide repeat protein [gamma proteobacterium SS-5]